jgi:cytidylate kinase
MFLCILADLASWRFNQSILDASALGFEPGFLDAWWQEWDRDGWKGDTMMSPMTQLDLCRSYLAASTSVSQAGRKPGTAPDGPVVTISRQAGARANTIATELVKELSRSKKIPLNRPWTVFNQNLLDHVIREHCLPEQTAAYFPEDRPDEIRALIAEMLGLHPGSYTSARKMAETIRSLAVAGNTVIVGRGANLITMGIKQSLHVRFVGSRESRVRHYARKFGLSDGDAAREVDRLDRARKRYVKSNFEHDIEDSKYYDLVVNTDGYDNASVCRMLRLALEEKCG